MSESLSNTPFPIVKCVSLYLELITDENSSVILIVISYSDEFWPN